MLVLHRTLCAVYRIFGMQIEHVHARTSKKDSTRYNAARCKMSSDMQHSINRRSATICIVYIQVLLYLVISFFSRILPGRSLYRTTDMCISKSQYCIILNRNRKLKALRSSFDCDTPDWFC
jgi:hypothetical protein